MSIVCLPTFFVSCITQLSRSFDPRTRPRLAELFFGLLFCSEKRRTAAAWFRAAPIGDDSRPSYEAIASVGRRAPSVAVDVLKIGDQTIEADDEGRLVFALDDTPTKRYGPHVEGAGPNPRRGSQYRGRKRGAVDGRPRPAQGRLVAVSVAALSVSVSRDDPVNRPTNQSRPIPPVSVSAAPSSTTEAEVIV